MSVCRLDEPGALKLRELGSEVVPYVLARMHDFGPSMHCQSMLRLITKADIWVGDQATKDMRAYNVSESGKQWFKWAKNNSIKYDHIEWINKYASFSTC